MVVHPQVETCEGHSEDIFGTLKCSRLLNFKGGEHFSAGPPNSSSAGVLYFVNLQGGFRLAHEAVKKAARGFGILLSVNPFFLKTLESICSGLHFQVP